MSEAKYNYHGKELTLFDPLKEAHPEWETEGLWWHKTAMSGKKKYSVLIPDGNTAFAVDLGRELKQGFLCKEFEIVVREGMSSILVVLDNFTWDGSTCSSDWRSHLASLVHDCLCIAANKGWAPVKTYLGYCWKQAIYCDILNKQGFPKVWSYLRYGGLWCFNWL